MDLLRDEYASDSSAATDGKPIVEPDGSALTLAAARNHAEGPDEAKPAAPQSSGGTNKSKSSNSTSDGNHHTCNRICAACKESKSREEYSKNQWSKSGGKGRCKPCVGAPERPPRPAAAKRQNLNPERNQNIQGPDVVQIQVKFGIHWHPFTISKMSTVNDLKLLVCNRKRLNPGYGYFVSFQSVRPLRSSLTLEECLFAPGLSGGPRVELISPEHPTKLDRVLYLFDVDRNPTGGLVDLFRNSCPFRTIDHPSDIHDLVGTYDIICDVSESSASHDINLEAIPGLRMEIRPRGTDHIEGSVFGRCLCLYEDGDYLTFNTDTPWVSEKPDFDLDYLTNEYFANCQMIGAVPYRGDGETSLDYSFLHDSDEESPSELIGSIFVLKQRAFVPRLGSVDIIDFECERLLNEYNNAFSSSFIQHHFALPDSVGENVFDYWRTEPPPCLVLEKGDVFLTLTIESSEMLYVIARKKQNQKPFSRFEAWKPQETKNLLLRAPLSLSQHIP